MGMRVFAGRGKAPITFDPTPVEPQHCWSSGEPGICQLRPLLKFHRIPFFLNFLQPFEYAVEPVGAPVRKT
ncbi:hypothetical protein M3652_20680, partial [Bacillus intestinalis]|nr:hypothetical protein [Bacillus spizizenii]